MKIEDKKRVLREMVLHRRFEERCYQAYIERKIGGFLHLYPGQEACCNGVMEAARPGHDYVITGYRDHVHAIKCGADPKEVMAELYGKETGSSKGRGGSMHIFDARTRFYGGNAIVGGGIPLAVGLALADRMEGRRRVTACFFGEGAVAEGAFYESLNLAALWDLPVLFCCENNLYAMGTHVARSHSETDIALKTSTFRMPAWAVDGMDVLAVQEHARRAAALVRSEGGPAFLEFRTYRFRAHSMYDAERYRERSEVQEWRERDPLVTFPALLREDGLLDDDVLGRIDEEVQREVDEAVAFARAGTLEPVEDLARHVYADAGGGAL